MRQVCGIRGCATGRIDHVYDNVAIKNESKKMSMCEANESSCLVDDGSAPLKDALKCLQSRLCQAQPIGDSHARRCPRMV